MKFTNSDTHSNFETNTDKSRTLTLIPTLKNQGNFTYSSRPSSGLNIIIAGGVEQ